MLEPTIQLSNEKYTHAGLRRTCNTLWSSRGRRNFRLVRSSTWRNWGGGSSYLWMRKWNDTYVIGVRNANVQKEKYPQYDNFASGNYLELRDCWDDTAPTDWFWNDKPYFIIKPDVTYAPAQVDITRNNMAFGMGLGYGGQMYNNHLFRASTLAKLGGAFLNYDRDTLVLGGMMYTDDGTFTYGPTVRNPCLQVYDKGIYNKGRKALKDLNRVLDVYINRHKLFEAGGWGWNQEPWQPDWMWQVIDRYQKKGIEGLSPHWLLDTHTKIMEPIAEGQPQWWRERMMRIAMLSPNQITRAWKEQGIKLGFVRIAPRGTPLYNEVPLVEPGTYDYDQIILDD